MRLVAAAVLLVCATACPAFDEDGTYRCDRKDDCPSALECVANLCVSNDGGAPGTSDAGPVVDGGTQGLVDAGGDVTPDAGDAPKGPPRVRVLCAIDTGAFDVWIAPSVGPLSLFAGDLGREEVTVPVELPVGSATFFLTDKGATTTLGARATLVIALERGDDVLLVAAGDAEPGRPFALVRSDFTTSGDGAAQGSLVHASPFVGPFAIDVGDDGSTEVPELRFGAAVGLGAPGGLAPRRISLEFGPGMAIDFSVFAPPDAPSSGLVLVLAGNTAVPGLAPGGLRLLEVTPDLPLAVVRRDPWVVALNLLAPESPIALAVDGVVSEAEASVLGTFTGERQVSPALHTVQLRRGRATTDLLASKAVNLARGETLLSVAYGSAGPGESVEFVPFIDAVPRPVTGIAYDVINATRATVAPTLVVSRGGELHRQAAFAPGASTTTGSGLTAVPGPLRISVSTAGLPALDASFDVVTSAGERLLFILEPGATKPNLRVFRDLGPAQTITLVSPN